MENVKSKSEGNTYYIYLSGHVDSTNAPLVEEEINNLKKKFLDKALIIDAENLEYLSSAGLRIILRLLKENPTLKLINVSSEVYEVLDMTGFTQLLPVEKAFRKVSVEGCEVIGQGANGFVYRIDADTIIKVYKNKDSLPDIKRETDLARKAFVLGIPTAIPYDVVKVNDSYGSVFELLNAKSFSKILSTEPNKLDECVKLYVDLLKKIHSTHVKKGDMPDMKVVGVNWVKYLKEYIENDKFNKLTNLINAIPDVDTMIHGDYHTKNVMMQNGEILLIDMDTISVGHPVFEIASMYLAFIGFGEIHHYEIDNFLGIPYDLAHEFFYKAMALYLNTNDKKVIDSVVDKGRVIGYTRIIRRTLRREDIKNEQTKNKVEYFIKQLYDVLDKVDNLEF